MNETDKELIFVYNAESDIGSLVKDTVHKVVRPSTFPCNLAAVTYGPLGMKKSWKETVENLPISARFLYKDEFKENFDIEDAEFPCAYLNEDGEMKLFMNQGLMNSVDTVEELKNVLYQQMIEFDL